MKCTLLKPHTHAGVALPAGAAVELNEPERAWAIAQGVVAADGEKPGKAAKKAAADPAPNE